MSTGVLSQSQLLNTDSLIELYTIDTSTIRNQLGTPGGPVFNWTPGTLAQRIGGTVTGAVRTGGFGLIVLDQEIYPSPAGGYAIQCDNALTGATQSLPVGYFGDSGEGTTYVSVPGTAHLPAPGTPYVLSGPGVVSFGGTLYEPFPIAATGYAWSGQGTLPRPTLQIDNTILYPGTTVPLAASLVIAYADILGATVTRIRTFLQFLDGQPNADPTEMFEPDIYRVDRKSHHDKQYIEWELASSVDQLGLKLPARQVLRDVCNFSYRQWNAATGQFAYFTCPYTGSALFDATGAAQTDPSKDSCSKQLTTGCLARYPQPQPLPFGGFPGVGLVSL